VAAGSEETQIITDYSRQNVTGNFKGKLSFSVCILYHLSLLLFWLMKWWKRKKTKD